jgi:diguanylate cyclase (GGDEF)-like protein
MFETVMIADDSIPMHALIKAHFRADHLSFHSVYDGAAAVTLAASLQPDLILLDLDMPQMDGFEACRRMKGDPATAAIPVMFLSANSVAADKQKALLLGAFDYVAKPFKAEQLRARVHSTLQGVPNLKETTLLDPLTGLWNRSYFEVQLKRQFCLAQFRSQALACLVTAIDQIGVINVRYGSAVANQAVRQVAGVLSKHVGMDATLCGLPGRRFATLLRCQDRFEASLLAERLRGHLDQTLVLEDGLQLKVTCSFGVCDNLVATPTTLFARASEVLNRAADRGGNCVAVARAGAKART